MLNLVVHLISSSVSVFCTGQAKHMSACRQSSSPYFCLRVTRHIFLPCPPESTQGASILALKSGSVCISCTGGDSVHTFVQAGVDEIPSGKPEQPPAPLVFCFFGRPLSFLPLLHPEHNHCIYQGKILKIILINISECFLNTIKINSIT